MSVDDVPPVTPLRDFRALDCDQLKVEANRIDAEFKPYISSFRHGTRDGIARLKGEAIAVNASLQEQGCKVAMVVLPTNRLRTPSKDEAGITRN